MSIFHADPDLQGRFHPQYPNDLQVLVHEGSYRFTDKPPEVMWVTLTVRLEWTNQDGVEGYAYKGILLNQPRGLTSLKMGDEILFKAKKGYKFPVRVTREYAAQRDYCEITPCDNCGLPELFDAPSRLIAKAFPDLAKSENMETNILTSFCPICGKAGIMVVNILNATRIKELSGGID